MAGVFGTLAGISVSTSHIRFLFLWSIGTEKNQRLQVIEVDISRISGIQQKYFRGP